MDVKIDALPNWVFRGDEISPNMYKVYAKHVWGPSIELTGTDPDELLEEAKRTAKKMEEELKRKMGNNKK